MAVQWPSGRFKVSWLNGEDKDRLSFREIESDVIIQTFVKVIGSKSCKTAVVLSAPSLGVDDYGPCGRLAVCFRHIGGRCKREAESSTGVVQSSAIEFRLQLMAFKRFLELAGTRLTGKDYTEVFDAACFPLILLSSGIDLGWWTGMAASAMQGQLGLLVEAGADNDGNPGPLPYNSAVHAARSLLQNTTTISSFHILGAAAPNFRLFAPADSNRLCELVAKAPPIRRMFSAIGSASLGAVVEVLDVPGYIDEFSDSISCENTGHSVVVEALENFLIKHKGLQPKDAQFLSKNCPGFISKVVAANTQRWAIERDSELEDGVLYEQWLMGNLNELEPFLESIGLDPEKVEEVLPFVQMPLDGEQGLLRNVEILEGMGISRGSLWDVLEQNKQLLAMAPEDLRATVDFLEGLGVKSSKEMVGLIEETFFLTDSLATLKNLNDVGVQKDMIAKIIKSGSIQGGLIDMPVGSFQERVKFLVESGLSKNEVAQSLKLFPQLLHLRLENLRRKIQFFDSIGLERDRVAKIIARWPLVFGQSMEKKLRPKIEMLQGLGVGRDGIAKILTRYPELRAVSLEDNLKQKVAFFEENGLRGKRLVKLMTSHPRALTLSVNELNKKLDFLVKKGFALGSVEMVRALGVCITISVESMAARFVNLESLGFSPEAGREVVKQQPAILSLSEKCIQDKVHYVLNDMHRSIDEIVRCPCYLLYSLELRIKPRHRVLSLLKSEGVLREEAYSLNTIMIMSEKRFMERFVISLGAQFPQVAAAYYNRG